mmetsp:Transcript_5033/g.7560  ORF Transcript_5033/g.7560 Transcript_5033/m.7560 type:complete len:592 (-) Transcript_5033:2246-4021(-)
MNMGNCQSKRKQAKGGAPSLVENQDDPSMRSEDDEDKKTSPAEKKTIKRRLERTNTTHYLRVHEAAMAEIFKKGNGMIGLRNLGNTCYMNACIQALSQNIGLADYFLGYDWDEEINETNPTGHKGAVARSFGELLGSMWSLKQDTRNIVNPLEFKKRIAQCAPMFSGYEQHDAHEFLTFLLDALHEDLNRCKSKPLVAEVECDGNDQERSAARAWEGYLRRDKSIIVDLFQGQLRSTLECLECKKVRIKFDSFQFLSVPIPQNQQHNLDLEQCIEEFAMNETVECMCPHCAKNTLANKRLELWKLPPILIVHLKRFRFDQNGRAHKLSHYIDFPIADLDLSPYCRSPQRDVPLYDLFAVIEHRGNTNSGHYITRARNRVNGNWYFYDDSRVSPIPNMADITTDGAYVLFYSRVVLNDGANSSPNVFAESKSGAMSRALRQVIQSPPQAEKKQLQPTRSLSPTPCTQRPIPTTQPPLVRRQSISLPHLWPHYQEQPNTLPPLRLSSDSTPGQLPIFTTNYQHDRGSALLGGAPSELFAPATTTFVTSSSSSTTASSFDHRNKLPEVSTTSTKNTPRTTETTTKIIQKKKQRT